jgi:hypothetical protein
LLPTGVLSDALTVAERSSLHGMPLADQQDQGVTSMQAGFPVAAQAPVALQPRQIIPPLPTGTERTLVAVPQFGVALANALANDPPVDQATVPAAQSATSGQDILAAMSVATANPTSKPINSTCSVAARLIRRISRLSNSANIAAAWATC